MIAWIVYSLAVSLLVTLAAALLEPAFRSLALPIRGGWAAAMAISLGIPAAAALRPVAPSLPVAEPGAWIAMSEVGLAIAAGVEASPPLTGLDALLRFGWPAASAAVLLVLALSAWRLHRLRRDWWSMEVEGTPVLVSPDLGPAVVGVLRASIVVPRWVLEMPTDARRLLLEHEREHLRAGDLRLLAAALLLAAAMPWNPFLWWQLRRLRLALEVDCDARVLRRHPDIGAYGATLIEAGGFASRSTVAMAAFTERRTTLERRIRLMTMPAPTHPVRRALGLAAVAAAGLAVACEVPAPTQLQPAQGPAEGLTAVSTPQLAAEPAFTPRTREPELSPEQREALMQRLSAGFPAELRDAGSIRVRVVLWTFIDEQGRTLNTKVVESSGHPAFDRLAQDALLGVTWTPARNGDEPAPVWIQLPVGFHSPPG